MGFMRFGTRKNEAEYMKLTLIKAWGYVGHNGTVRFLAPDGIKSQNLTVIGEDDIDTVESASLKARWIRCAQKCMSQAQHGVSRANATGWMRRAESMAKAVTIREKFRGTNRDQSATRTGKPYESTTWTEAWKRMRQSIRNKVKRAARPPWKQWAFTASNNLNKRRGGVYSNG